MRGHLIQTSNINLTFVKPPRFVDGQDSDFVMTWPIPDLKDVAGCLAIRESALRTTPFSLKTRFKIKMYTLKESTDS